MILPVVKYGNPILRKKGKRIEKVTPELKQLISDMLETMRAARGVGLAAHQVGHALQLTVLDVTGITDRPSALFIKDQAVEVPAHMPLVLINPELRTFGDPTAGPEGCLSFPEIFGEITRPSSVEVAALNAKGAAVEYRCGGLLSRAIQHEFDHLQGILFIDRMSAEKRRELRPELEALQAETKAALRR